MQKHTPKFLLVFSLLVLVTTGCTTHRQLRSDHVMQAKSLTTIYEQQVLDNLAMFHQDANSLPFFATPGAGSATVTDGIGTAVGPFNVGKVVLSPIGVERGNQQQWNLKPLNDAKKLKYIQWLLQQAVGGGIKYKVSSPRRRSECRLKGSYCGCHIELCEDDRAAFTDLVLNILDVVENGPPVQEEEESATLNVEAYVYNQNGQLKKIYKYVAKDNADLTQASGTQPTDIESREGAIVPTPTSIMSMPSQERRELDRLNNENDLQLLRRSLGGG